MAIRFRRPGLVAALLIGPAACALTILLLGLRPSAALLVGWDVAVLVYLADLLRTALTLDPASARKHAEALDESRWGVLGSTLAAVMVSLAAVAFDLAGSRATAGSAALGMATVLLSWVFIHVLFANHYRHEHTLRGGIEFPGGEEHPDLEEFLYLSFTVGMTAQVSDVTTSSPTLRRLVLAHGLVSFVFNAAVVAGAVNIAAGLAH